MLMSHKNRFFDIKMRFQPVDLQITNTRTFQHLALLVDRPDFVRKTVLLRGIYFLRDKEGARKNVKKMLKEYSYPSKLEDAVFKAIFEKKVVDEDVKWYRPKTYNQRPPLRGYLHSILAIRVERNIREDRDLYWTNKNGIGYRKLADRTGRDLETIKSKIKSYSKKLQK